MEKWPERDAKLVLITKIENEERIILRVSSQDAGIYASAAVTHSRAQC
jgi:hypothetical protein